MLTPTVRRTMLCAVWGKYARGEDGCPARVAEEIGAEEREERGVWLVELGHVAQRRLGGGEVIENRERVIRHVLKQECQSRSVFVW